MTARRAPGGRPSTVIRPFTGLPHEPSPPTLADRLRYLWYVRPRLDPPLSRAEKWLVAAFALAAGIAGFAFRLALDGRL